MRGEHGIGLTVDVDALGSSPHARGTLQIREAIGMAKGIIPACAGNTSLESRLCLARRDHPRMRGEHEVGKIGPEIVTGSSPHARGTRGETYLTSDMVGIIPACAGNTHRRSGTGM